MNWFEIVKQIEPPTPKPYRIVERILTSDGGCRSRICAGVWSSLEEAQEALKLKEEHKP